MRATPISTALALVLSASAIAAWPAVAQTQQGAGGQSTGQHKAEDQQSGADANVVVTGEEDADVTIIRPDEEGKAELGDTETEATIGALGQRRAEEVIGQPLVNATGEEIGDIDDLVLDSDQIVYAVVGVGGLLGMGERKVAIPFEQIQLSEDEAQIMTLMTEEDLKALPEYDPEQYEPMERERATGE